MVYQHAAQGYQQDEEGADDPEAAMPGAELLGNLSPETLFTMMVMLMNHLVILFLILFLNFASASYRGPKL